MSISLEVMTFGKGIMLQRVTAICSACPLSLKLSIKKVAVSSLQCSFQFQSYVFFNSSPIWVKRTVAFSPSIPETKINTCGYFVTMSSKIMLRCLNTINFWFRSFCAIYAAATYSWKVLWRKQYSCWGFNLFRLSSLYRTPSSRATNPEYFPSNSSISVSRKP